jgi:hypothetical protein
VLRSGADVAGGDGVPITVAPAMTANAKRIQKETRTLVARLDQNDASVSTPNDAPSHAVPMISRRSTPMK